MRIDITGRHVDVTPALRQVIERRLSRVERLLNDSAVSATAILTLEKYRHRTEIIVHARGDKMLRGLGEGNAWNLSIRQAIEKVEQQAKKVQGKWTERKRSETRRRTPRAPAGVHPRAARSRRPRSAPPPGTRAAPDRLRRRPSPARERRESNPARAGRTSASPCRASRPRRPAPGWRSSAPASGAPGRTCPPGTYAGSQGGACTRNPRPVPARNCLCSNRGRTLPWHPRRGNGAAPAARYNRYRTRAPLARDIRRRSPRRPLRALPCRARRSSPPRGAR